MNVAKQRFREAQDELEELRALIQDQQSQLDDYRNKVSTCVIVTPFFLLRWLALTIKIVRKLASYLQKI